MDATWWLIGLPMAASPLAYVLGRIDSKAHLPAYGARWLTLGILALMWGMFGRIVAGELPRTVLFGSVPFVLDGLSILLLLITLLLSTAALFVPPMLGAAAHEEKYYAALLVMTGTLIGLMCSADLFNLWVWFEALTIASYLLVLFYGVSEHAPYTLRIGLQYLLQTAFGSVLILLGIALVLLQTGTLSLAELRGSALHPSLLTAAMCLVAGFGVKIALVPLHAWLPDAHAQAPSGISALLSGVVIEAALIALLRVLAIFGGFAFSWGALLMALGTLNLLYGNLMALRQTQVKRILAYSSISQVGYMLLGVGIGLHTESLAAVQAGLFHLFTHSLMKGLAFLAVGVFMLEANLHRMTAEQLSGGGRRYPGAALALTLALLGLAGLPPLAGFMSKWQVFAAGMATDNVLIAALVVFAALNSVLALGYYMPIVNALYRQQVAPELTSGRSLPPSSRLMLLLALPVVLIGLYPDLMAGLTRTAALVLLQAFGG